MTHFVLLGAVLALLIFIYFLHRFSATWALRDWRRTLGQVVTAEMRRGKKKTSDGCLLYDPVLRYSYTVGERTFEGNRFIHQAVRNPPHLTTQFIPRLTRGAEVPAHCPRNPTAAVVPPLSWQGSAMAALTCALLLVLLATALWVA